MSELLLETVGRRRSPDPLSRATLGDERQLLAGAEWDRRRPCVAVRVELPLVNPATDRREGRDSRKAAALWSYGLPHRR